jgi:hypothetical protein
MLVSFIFGTIDALKGAGWLTGCRRSWRTCR